MKSSIKSQTPTKTVLTVEATEAELKSAYNKVVAKLGKKVKVAGFRAGKAPVEKLAAGLDPSLLTDEVLNTVVNQLAAEAMQTIQVAPALPPTVDLDKFVPFSTLEFSINIATIGKVTLPDYKKKKYAKPVADVKQEDVELILKRIQMDLSSKSEVARKSKLGDQVWINFVGKDKDGELIEGASGDDYPLSLGSNTFIPGFEDKLIGYKAGENVTFEITFPKDYQAKHLQSKQAQFECLITKVEEVTVPKLDDKLAALAGPYKTIKELREYIEQQSKSEQIYQMQLELESDIVKDIATGATIELPEELIEAQVERMVQDQARSLINRGQELDSWLKQNEQTIEEYRVALKDDAEMRIKGGVVLSEIAKQENITYDEQDIDNYVAKYAEQFHGDTAMQEQLQTDAGRRDIAARILTDKTIEFLRTTLVKA